MRQTYYVSCGYLCDYRSGRRIRAATKAEEVDAVLDGVGDDESPATALADLLDDRGEWDWTDGPEHDPSDRMAILESSGAWWYVYRGTEPDQAERLASEDEARAMLAAEIAEVRS